MQISSYNKTVAVLVYLVGILCLLGSIILFRKEIIIVGICFTLIIFYTMQNYFLSLLKLEVDEIVIENIFKKEKRYKKGDVVTVNHLFPLINILRIGFKNNDSCYFIAKSTSDVKKMLEV